MVPITLPVAYWLRCQWKPCQPGGITYIEAMYCAGVLYAASLWLSNSAYLYLSVSFIQMTKSLMPGLVYACGVALGTEKFSQGAASNMTLIAFGVLVCAYGELNLVFKGVVQQLLALAFEVSMVACQRACTNGSCKTLSLRPAA